VSGQWNEGLCGREDEGLQLICISLGRKRPLVLVQDRTVLVRILAVLIGLPLIGGMAAAWLTGQPFRLGAVAFWCLMVVAAIAVVVTWGPVVFLWGCTVDLWDCP
jgi:hypothetical protein